VTVAYLGSLTLGQCVPTALAASAALDLAIGLSLPKLQARLEAALKAQAQLTLTPPTLAASLTAAAALAAALSVSVGMPSIGIQLAALASLIAAIELEIGALQVQAAFGVAFAAMLGTAGIYCYTYTGRADQFGPQINSATLGGFPGGQPSDSAGAIVLAATIPAAKIALGAFAGVSLDIG
jgi:hypothetical protein